MKKLDSICGKIVKSVATHEEYVWPPVCGGFFYQPERPTASKRQVVKTVYSGEKKIRSNQM